MRFVAAEAGFFPLGPLPLFAGMVKGPTAYRDEWKTTRSKLA